MTRNVPYRGHSPGSAVLGWAEEKLVLAQVLINLVGDRHLGVGKRLKSLLVRLGHLGLNVVKQQGERLAAQLGHLVQLALQSSDLLAVGVN